MLGRKAGQGSHTPGETLQLETNICRLQHKDDQGCPRMDANAQKEHIQKSNMNPPKHRHQNKGKGRRSQEEDHHTGWGPGTGKHGKIGGEVREGQVF